MFIFHLKYGDVGIVSYLNRPISCKMQRLLSMVCEKVFIFAFGFNVDADVNLRTQKLINS